MKNKNLYRMINGVKVVLKNKYLFVVLLVYLVLIALLNNIGKNFLYGLREPFSSDLFLMLFTIFLLEIAVIGLVGLLVVFGTPKGSKKINKSMREIGLIDRIDESPILLSKTDDKHGSLLEFYSERIPKGIYENNKEAIETVLNVKILGLDYGRDSQHVIIKTIPSWRKLPDVAKWNDNLLSKDDFVLKLGESYYQTEEFDLTLFPQVLIGGGTGSGKSNLLKLLLLQCVKKGADVTIADFKGGVDYSGVWHEKCTMIIDSLEFSNKLTEALNTLKQRQIIFLSVGAKDIHDYNEKTNSNLHRIILACDEVAEVLDKRGTSKETKALIDEIERKMQTITSIGRAFGIHMILATQRPDADVMDGKIKSNLGMRICGRADKVLSQIVLDKSDAAAQVNQHDPGLFLTNTNVLFKAYYVTDDDLK